MSVSVGAGVGTLEGVEDFNGVVGAAAPPCSSLLEGFCVLVCEEVSEFDDGFVLPGGGFFPPTGFTNVLETVGLLVCPMAVESE